MAEPSRTETCATHGLHYDASLYNGCVLCRRLEEGGVSPKVERGKRRLSVRLLAMLVCGVAVAAVAVWYGFGRSGARVGAAAEGGDGALPPGEPAPRRSEAVQPVPGPSKPPSVGAAKTPEPVDFLELVNRMNPEGAGADEAGPSETESPAPPSSTPETAHLRQLKMAYEGEDRAARLQILKQHRELIPELDLGSTQHPATPKPFVLNRHGVGLDAVRFVVPSTSGVDGASYLVAAPPEVTWQLEPHIFDGYYWSPRELTQVAEAPWPADYRAQVEALEPKQLRHKEYAVVFRFPSDAPVTVYVAAASYTTSKATSKFQGKSIRVDAKYAQELAVGAPRSPQALMKMALWYGNKGAVQAILASGVDINSEPSLAYALVGMWPLEDVPWLLEQGADLNTPYKAVYPLFALVKRIKDCSPRGVSRSKMYPDEQVAAMIEAFVKRGASKHARSTSKEQTALELARERECPRTIAALQ